MNGYELLNKLGFRDPRDVGAMEYSALYEALGDALTNSDTEVAEAPQDFAAAILHEFISHAAEMLKLLHQVK